MRRVQCPRCGEPAIDDGFGIHCPNCRVIGEPNICTSTYDEALADYLEDVDRAEAPYIEPSDAVKRYDLQAIRGAKHWPIGSWLYFPPIEERGDLNTYYGRLP